LRVKTQTRVGRPGRYKIRIELFPVSYSNGWSLLRDVLSPKNMILWRYRFYRWTCEVIEGILPYAGLVQQRTYRKTPDVCTDFTPLFPSVVWLVFFTYDIIYFVTEYAWMYARNYYYYCKRSEKINREKTDGKNDAIRSV